MIKVTLLNREWHWPESDTDAKQYYKSFNHSNFPNEISTLCKKRNVVLQAGGHVGMYASLYSETFDYVYTFEPEQTNFECLEQNIKSKENIYAKQYALGDENKLVSINLNLKNTGNHTIAGNENGNVPCITIDSLNLPDLDLLHLDTEGYELFVLKGAENTIKKFKPLIVLEANNFCLNYNYSLEDLENWLFNLGYRCFKKWTEDRAYQFTETGNL
jgi:FkbM family methyltransferase